jgi:hypothetical protein
MPVSSVPLSETHIAGRPRIRQPTQFVARIRHLIEQLPLPEASPPPIVGDARRLDDAAELLRLAKQWKDCLDDCYLERVNDGQTAVYMWPHRETPATCVINRHGRLGWALGDAKGPENVELPPARTQEISSAFAAAGIPQSIAIDALEFEHSVIGRRHRQAHR